MIKSEQKINANRVSATFACKINHFLSLPIHSFDKVTDNSVNFQKDTIATRVSVYSKAYSLSKMIILISKSFGRICY